MTQSTNPAFIPALRAAAAFFEANPDKRVTGTFARDASGGHVTPRDPSATCWCALGRVLVELGQEAYDEAERRAYSPERRAYSPEPFAVLEYLAPWHSTDLIWEHNDDRKLISETPEVVANLRKIADELENAPCT